MDDADIWNVTKYSANLHEIFSSNVYRIDSKELEGMKGTFVLMLNANGKQYFRMLFLN